MIATKPITGSWFEFLHHNTPEGKYWNEALTAFTEEQWRLKHREMKGAGLKYVVLMATALYSKAYFKTDIFPEWKIGCANPIEVLLDEADRLDLRVFIGTGFYGDWTDADGNMKDPAVLSRMLRAINELAALYGHHRSFYGWYYTANGIEPENGRMGINLVAEGDVIELIYSATPFEPEYETETEAAQ